MTSEERFLKDTKAHAIKKNINKFYYVKIKNFCLQKHHLER